jgi:hypothetical protein
VTRREAFRLSAAGLAAAVAAGSLPTRIFLHSLAADDETALGALSDSVMRSRAIELATEYGDEAIIAAVRSSCYDGVFELIASRSENEQVIWLSRFLQPFPEPIQTARYIAALDRLDWSNPTSSPTVASAVAQYYEALKSAPLPTEILGPGDAALVSANLPTTSLLTQCCDAATENSGRLLFLQSASAGSAAILRAAEAISPLVTWTGDLLAAHAAQIRAIAATALSWLKRAAAFFARENVLGLCRGLGRANWAALPWSPQAGTQDLVGRLRSRGGSRPLWPSTGCRFVHVRSASVVLGPVSLARYSLSPNRGGRGHGFVRILHDINRLVGVVAGSPQVRC